MPSEQSIVTAAGRPLTASAVALMLVLCLTWGFNQIAIKLAMLDIPPFLQGAIRSCGALLVILLVARLRGVKMFARDGTLRAGLFAGRAVRLRIHRDLSRPATHLRLARRGVHVYRAVLRGLRRLLAARRAAARRAMERAGAELCRGGAGYRRAAARCRRQRAAGRPPDRGRRRRCGPPPHWW